MRLRIRQLETEKKIFTSDSFIVFLEVDGLHSDYFLFRVVCVVCMRATQNRELLIYMFRIIREWIYKVQFVLLLWSVPRAEKHILI